MAFSTLEKALALAVGLDIAKPGTSRKAATAAARFLASGTARAAPVVASGIGSLAAANPVATGTALGLGALATPPGQMLLESAAERGAANRIAVQQMVDEAIFRSTVLPARQLQTAVESPAFRPAVKRKVSKYSKAVKAGMAAVKASKFGGAKGKISNAKSAFKTVNLVASAVNKGKKVSSKGIRGTVARAVKRILK